MRGRSQESDAVLRKQFRELRFLGGVPPSSPNGLHGDALGDVENKVHVGVIVVVRASRDGNVVIRQPNVFGIGLGEGIKVIFP